LELDISLHYPDVKASVTFLVGDVDKYYETINKKGIGVSEPCNSHLELRKIKFYTSEGIPIIIHGPTNHSPRGIG
jgi:hypothetical protein